MGNLVLSNNWPADIYQIETVDPVVGGVPNRAPLAGTNNIAAQELGDRTEWLKARVGGLGGEAATVADLDTVVVTGFFEFGTTATGNPKSGTAGIVIHTQLAANKAAQVAYLEDGTTGQRFRDTGGVWSGWLFLNTGAPVAKLHALEGFEKLPSGLIMQWGFSGVMNNDWITFPLAFPTEAFSVVACENEQIRTVGVVNREVGRFQVNFNPVPAAASGIYWQAMGH